MSGKKPAASVSTSTRAEAESATSARSASRSAAESGWSGGAEGRPPLAAALPAPPPDAAASSVEIASTPLPSMRRSAGTALRHPSRRIEAAATP